MGKSKFPGSWRLDQKKSKKGVLYILLENFNTQQPPIKVCKEYVLGVMKSLGVSGGRS